METTFVCQNELHRECSGNILERTRRGVRRHRCECRCHDGVVGAGVAKPKRTTAPKGERCALCGGVGDLVKSVGGEWICADRCNGSAAFTQRTKRCPECHGVMWRLTPPEDDEEDEGVWVCSSRAHTPIPEKSRLTVRNGVIRLTLADGRVYEQTVGKTRKSRKKKKPAKRVHTHKWVFDPEESVMRCASCRKRGEKKQLRRAPRRRRQTL
jgi:hypothetical protein